MNDLADKEFQVASAALDAGILPRTKPKGGMSSNGDYRSILHWRSPLPHPALAEIQIYLLVLSCGVTAASWLLVLHYNRRLMGVRNQAVTIIAWMKVGGVNYDSIINQNTQGAYSRGEDYELQELILFMCILAASLIAVLLSLIFSHSN